MNYLPDFNYDESHGFEDDNSDFDFGAREFALDIGLEPYVSRPLITNKLMEKCPR